MKQTTRQFMSRRLQTITLALAFTLSITAIASARSDQQDKFSKIRIKNFGQMDERFYRGAEPKGLEDIQALKDIGVNTVIDLQEKPEATERGNVESLGMRYVNIPMVDKAYPKPEWVAEFLKTVDDPSTGKFYVHCAGGRHRTGAMGAVYRFEKYGWNYDQVYAEMKQFDFYTSWGHGDFKTFVQDYAKQMQARGVNATTTVATTTTAPAAKAAKASASSVESIFAGNHR